MKKENRRKIAKYSWCRGVQHIWEKASPMVVSGRNIEILWKCTRCGTFRKQVIDPSGRYAKSTVYVHPEDYLAKGERVSRRESRVIAFFEEKILD